MPKERISLTVDRDLLAKLDYYSDSSVIGNRSAAVESILSNYFQSKEIKRAVILCGGKGTRMRPFTYEVPKSMLPVKGKPILEHLLDVFKKNGIREIVLSVGYLKEKIRAHFGDGSRFGVSITYVEEESPLGTAGPLRMCKDLLEGTFAVSNGDELKDINITDMLHKFHKPNGALATIALTSVEDPSSYGVAKLSGNRILEFVEKPEKGKAPSNFINSGLYILDPEIIKLIPKGFSMLEKDVFPKLAKMGKLFGYTFSGQWFDLGTPERYEKAIREWKGIK